MLFLTAARRLIIPNLAFRPFLARPISSSPVFYFPKKAVKNVAAKPKTDKTKKLKPKTPKPKKVLAKKGVKKPAVEKKTKVKVPKRAGMTGYTMFFTEQLKGTQGNMKDKTVNIARQWNSMSDEDKAPFQKKADEFNATRTKAWSEWRAVASLQDIREYNRKLRGTKKRRIRVKQEGRPLNSYMRFLADYKVDHPWDQKQRVVEYARVAGAAYRALPESRRQMYEDAFHKELRVWREERQPLA